ncbi:MAG: hypothetical protein LBT52_03440 [Clostridiales Family XIII bacterium]|jgi:hypothetical protein|nr:hypothetical protein [Clostridiales Family XIII bacterium]
MTDKLNPAGERILQLLREVADICERADIPYVLAEQTAYDAYRLGELRAYSTFGHMMISASDCARFLKAMSAHMPKERMIDHLGVNPKFNGFYLRYTDERSTYVSLLRHVGFQSHGVHIRITLARRPVRGALKRKFLLLVERSLYAASTFGIRKSFAAVCCACAYTVLTGFRSRTCTKKLFNAFLRAHARGGDFFRFIEPMNIARLRESVLTETAWATLGGQRFKVPRDTAGYLKALSGRNPDLLEMPYYIYEKMHNNVLSVRIDYRTYLASLGPERIKRHYRRAAEAAASGKSKKLTEARDRINKVWDVAQYISVIEAIERNLDASGAEGSEPASGTSRPGDPVTSGSGSGASDSGQEISESGLGSSSREHLEELFISYFYYKSKIAETADLIPETASVTEQYKQFSAGEVSP